MSELSINGKIRKEIERLEQKLEGNMSGKAAESIIRKKDALSLEIDNNYRMGIRD